MVKILDVKQAHYNTLFKSALASESQKLWNKEVNLKDIRKPNNNINYQNEPKPVLRAKTTYSSSSSGFGRFIGNCLSATNRFKTSKKTKINEPKCKPNQTKQLNVNDTRKTKTMYANSWESIERIDKRKFKRSKKSLSKLQKSESEPVQKYKANKKATPPKQETQKSSKKGNISHSIYCYIFQRNKHKKTTSVTQTDDFEINQKCCGLHTVTKANAVTWASDLVECKQTSSDSYGAIQKTRVSASEDTFSKCSSTYIDKDESKYKNDDKTYFSTKNEIDETKTDKIPSKKYPLGLFGSKINVYGVTEGGWCNKIFYKKKKPPPPPPPPPPPIRQSQAEEYEIEEDSIRDEQNVFDVQGEKSILRPGEGKDLSSMGSTFGLHANSIRKYENVKPASYIRRTNLEAEDLDNAYWDRDKYYLRDGKCIQEYDSDVNSIVGKGFCGLRCGKGKAEEFSSDASEPDKMQTESAAEIETQTSTSSVYTDRSSSRSQNSKDTLANQPEGRSMKDYPSTIDGLGVNGNPSQMTHLSITDLQSKKSKSAVFTEGHRMGTDSATKIPKQGYCGLYYGKGKSKTAKRTKSNLSTKVGATKTASETDAFDLYREGSRSVSPSIREDPTMKIKSNLYGEESGTDDRNAQKGNIYDNKDKIEDSGVKKVPKEKCKPYVIKNKMEDRSVKKAPTEKRKPDVYDEDKMEDSGVKKIPKEKRKPYVIKDKMEDHNMRDTLPLADGYDVYDDVKSAMKSRSDIYRSKSRMRTDSTTAIQGGYCGVYNKSKSKKSPQMKSKSDLARKHSLMQSISATEFPSQTGVSDRPRSQSPYRTPTNKSKTDMYDKVEDTSAKTVPSKKGKSDKYGDKGKIEDGEGVPRKKEKPDKYGDKDKTEDGEGVKRKKDKSDKYGDKGKIEDYRGERIQRKKDKSDKYGDKSKIEDYSGERVSRKKDKSDKYGDKGRIEDYSGVKVSRTNGKPDAYDDKDKKESRSAKSMPSIKDKYDVYDDRSKMKGRSVKEDPWKKTGPDLYDDKYKIKTDSPERMSSSMVGYDASKMLQETLSRKSKSVVYGSKSKMEVDSTTGIQKSCCGLYGKPRSDGIMGYPVPKPKLDLASEKSFTQSIGVEEISSQTSMSSFDKDGSKRGTYADGRNAEETPFTKGKPDAYDEKSKMKDYSRKEAASEKDKSDVYGDRGKRESRSAKDVPSKKDKFDGYGDKSKIGDQSGKEKRKSDVDGDRDKKESRRAKSSSARKDEFDVYGDKSKMKDRSGKEDAWGKGKSDVYGDKGKKESRKAKDMSSKTDKPDVYGDRGKVEDYSGKETPWKKGRSDVYSDRDRKESRSTKSIPAKKDEFDIYSDKGKRENRATKHIPSKKDKYDIYGDKSKMEDYSRKEAPREKTRSDIYGDRGKKESHSAKYIPSKKDQSDVYGGKSKIRDYSAKTPPREKSKSDIYGEKGQKESRDAKDMQSRRDKSDVYADKEQKETGSPKRMSSTIVGYDGSKMLQETLSKKSKSVVYDSKCRMEDSTTDIRKSCCGLYGKSKSDGIMGYPVPKPKLDLASEKSFTQSIGVEEISSQTSMSSFDKDGSKRGTYADGRYAEQTPYSKGKSDVYDEKNKMKDQSGKETLWGKGKSDVYVDKGKGESRSAKDMPTKRDKFDGYGDKSKIDERRGKEVSTEKRKSDVDRDRGKRESRRAKSVPAKQDETDVYGDKDKRESRRAKSIPHKSKIKDHSGKEDPWEKGKYDVYGDKGKKESRKAKDMPSKSDKSDVYSDRDKKESRKTKDMPSKSDKPDAYSDRDKKESRSAKKEEESDPYGDKKKIKSRSAKEEPWEKAKPDSSDKKDKIKTGTPKKMSSTMVSYDGSKMLQETLSKKSKTGVYDTKRRMQTDSTTHIGNNYCGLYGKPKSDDRVRDYPIRKSRSDFTSKTRIMPGEEDEIFLAKPDHYDDKKKIKSRTDKEEDKKKGKYYIPDERQPDKDGIEDRDKKRKRSKSADDKGKTKSRDIDRVPSKTDSTLNVYGKKKKKEIPTTQQVLSKDSDFNVHDKGRSTKDRSAKMTKGISPGTDTAGKIKDHKMGGRDVDGGLSKTGSTSEKKEKRSKKEIPSKEGESELYDKKGKIKDSAARKSDGAAPGLLYRKEMEGDAVAKKRIHGDKDAGRTSKSTDGKEEALSKKVEPDIYGKTKTRERISTTSEDSVLGTRARKRKMEEGIDGTISSKKHGYSFYDDGKKGSGFISERGSASLYEESSSLSTSTKSRSVPSYTSTEPALRKLTCGFEEEAMHYRYEIIVPLIESEEEESFTEDGIHKKKKHTSDLNISTEKIQRPSIIVTSSSESLPSFEDEKPVRRYKRLPPVPEKEIVSDLYTSSSRESSVESFQPPQKSEESLTDMLSDKISETSTESSPSSSFITPDTYSEVEDVSVSETKKKEEKYKKPKISIVPSVSTRDKYTQTTKEDSFLPDVIQDEKNVFDAIVAMLNQVNKELKKPPSQKCICKIKGDCLKDELLGTTDHGKGFQTAVYAIRNKVPFNKKKSVPKKLGPPQKAFTINTDNLKLEVKTDEAGDWLTDTIGNLEMTITDKEDLKARQAKTFANKSVNTESIELKCIDCHCRLKTEQVGRGLGGLGTSDVYTQTSGTYILSDKEKDLLTDIPEKTSSVQTDGEMLDEALSTEDVYETPPLLPSDTLLNAQVQTVPHSVLSEEALDKVPKRLEEPLLEKSVEVQASPIETQKEPELDQVPEMLEKSFQVQTGADISTSTQSLSEIQEIPEKLLDQRTTASQASEVFSDSDLLRYATINVYKDVSSAGPVTNDDPNNFAVKIRLNPTDSDTLGEEMKVEKEKGVGVRKPQIIEVRFPPNAKIKSQPLQGNLYQKATDLVWPRKTPSQISKIPDLKRYATVNMYKKASSGAPLSDDDPNNFALKIRFNPSDPDTRDEKMVIEKVGVGAHLLPKATTKSQPLRENLDQKTTGLVSPRKTSSQISEIPGLKRYPTINEKAAPGELTSDDPNKFTVRSPSDSDTRNVEDERKKIKNLKAAVAAVRESQIKVVPPMIGKAPAGESSDQKATSLAKKTLAEDEKKKVETVKAVIAALGGSQMKLLLPLIKETKGESSISQKKVAPTEVQPPKESLDQKAISLLSARKTSTQHQKPADSKPYATINIYKKVPSTQPLAADSSRRFIVKIRFNPSDLDTQRKGLEMEKVENLRTVGVPARESQIKDILQILEGTLPRKIICPYYTRDISEQTQEKRKCCKCGKKKSLRPHTGIIKRVVCTNRDMIAPKQDKYNIVLKSFLPEITEMKTVNIFIPRRNVGAQVIIKRHIMLQYPEMMCEETQTQKKSIKNT